MKSKIYFTLMCICVAHFIIATENRPVSTINYSEESAFLKDRIPNNDKRYLSLFLALQLMKDRNAKIIVETGTAREGDQNFIGDGGATIIYADWANRNNAKVYSVDIDPSCIEAAQNATKKYAENLSLVCSDSVEFLKSFSHNIDFLYLDSFDYDSYHPLPSQMHHLNEIIAAYPRLHPGSVVMIDDCALPGGGKGKLAIDYLVKRGWKILYNGYQVILTGDDMKS